MKTKDNKLLLLISQKNVDAFDTFYYRYIRLIYRFVFRELKDEVLTDDLIQEFWLSVWEDPTFLKCNDKGSVQAYMLQYMKFRILDIYRKTLSGFLHESNFEKVECVQVDYDNITEGLNEKELLRIIREALKNQPPIIRNTFWLRINNWSVEETAHTLSVSTKTIYNKYSESLTVVREHIRDHYPEFADIRKVRTES
jgi:RNA polymerase sigma-70 factor (ECF subfamily)